MSPLSAYTEEQIQAAALEARHELWRRGLLSYKRHATQRLLHAAIHSSPHRKHFLLCSRRLGKSYELLLEAFELCISKPGSKVLFLAPWAKDAAEIASDLAAVILEDCPEDLKPKYNSQLKEFTFERPAGTSIIRLKGVNGEHAQFLRGGTAHLVILDEVGLMTDLRTLLSDVVLPMTMTTEGRILMATTPATSPGHESTLIYQDLADIGAASKFTLRDAPHVKPHVKYAYLLEAGEQEAHIPAILAGTQECTTTTAKREYFCQFVTDADSAVVPEFADAQKHIVREWPRPAYFDTYVAMDPGMNDKTGMLFAYVDFTNHKLVIEDEALLHKALTPDIAATLQAKETANWGAQVPISRVCDVDLRLIGDLWTLHGVRFMQAEKVDAMAGTNLMRTMIRGHQIIINPRCTKLVQQLQNAIWNSKGKDFDRTELDAHFDLVAALRYLCRSINWGRNPFPEWYSRPAFGTWVPLRLRKQASYGLLGSTPFGRRIVKARK